jgi:hypothetical protein
MVGKPRDREIIPHACCGFATIGPSNLSFFPIKAQLLNEHPEFRHAYLDEVEYNLHCSNRFCRGGVRISLIHDDKNEGFVGGMA